MIGLRNYVLSKSSGSIIERTRALNIAFEKNVDIQ